MLNRVFRLPGADRKCCIRCQNVVAEKMLVNAKLYVNLDCKFNPVKKYVGKMSLFRLK